MGKKERTLRDKKTEVHAMELMKECLDPAKVPVTAVLSLIFPEARSFWYSLYHVCNKIKLQRLPGYELFYLVKSEVPKRLSETSESQPRSGPSMLEFLSKLVTDCREVPLQNPGSRPELTYSEMVSELFVSFFTQQTFNLTFSMCLHLLAKHPQVQARLQDELDRAFPANGAADDNNNDVTADTPLDYDKLCQLQYLDMVLNEVFRMYPVFQVIHRRCIRATRIGKLDVPAGMTVQPDVWSIQYDPGEFLSSVPSLSIGAYRVRLLS